METLVFKLDCRKVYLTKEIGTRVRLDGWVNKTASDSNRLVFGVEWYIYITNKVPKKGTYWGNARRNMLSRALKAPTIYSVHSYPVVI